MVWILTNGIYWLGSCQYDTWECSRKVFESIAKVTISSGYLALRWVVKRPPKGVSKGNGWSSVKQQNCLRRNFTVEFRLPIGLSAMPNSCVNPFLMFFRFVYGYCQVWFSKFSGCWEHYWLFFRRGSWRIMWSQHGTCPRNSLLSTSYLSFHLWMKRQQDVTDVFKCHLGVEIFGFRNVAYVLSFCGVCYFWDQF